MLLHYKINFPACLHIPVFVNFFCMAYEMEFHCLFTWFCIFQMIISRLHFKKINFSGMNNFYGSLNLLKILCMFYYMLDIVLFHLFSYINSPNVEVLQCLLESRASSPFETCFDGLRDTDWLSRPRRSMTGYST